MTHSATIRQTSPNTSGDAPQYSATVVIPCFNESESLQHLFASLEELCGHAPNLQLLFVDDSSTDDSALLLEEYCLERSYAAWVGHQSNQGIAGAIQTGIRCADTDLVCTIDADGTYDPAVLLPMMDLLVNEEADVVTASPYHPQGRVENVPAWRLLISRAASACYSLAFHSRLHTYTSCCRACRTQSVKHISVQNTDFVGVAEMLWRSDHAGHKIVEFPATLSTRQFGQSKLKVLRTTWGHVRLLFHIFLERAARV